MIASVFEDWDEYKDQESYLLRYTGLTRHDIINSSHVERRDDCRRLADIIKRENTPADKS